MGGEGGEHRANMVKEDDALERNCPSETYCHYTVTRIHCDFTSELTIEANKIIHCFLKAAWIKTHYVERKEPDLERQIPSFLLSAELVFKTLCVCV